MKNTTTVNGVTLTREQVEAALADLNTPDPILPGTKVTYIEGDYIVVDAKSLLSVADNHKKSPDQIILFNPRCGSFGFDSNEAVRKRVVKT